MPHSAAVQTFSADAGYYRARLLTFARRRLRDPALAEDAVQDAMLAAIENLDSYGKTAALGTWLTGILKHKIVDCVRQSARRLAMEDGGRALEDVPSAAGDPEGAARRGAALQRVADALARLPARASGAFVLYEVLGLSTPEVCARLAISKSNCAVLLHRTRRRLREQLAAQGIGADA